MKVNLNSPKIILRGILFLKEKAVLIVINHWDIFYNELNVDNIVRNDKRIKKIIP